MKNIKEVVLFDINPDPLKVFNIVMPFMDVFLVCCVEGFFDSMLEHHLSSKPIMATPGQIGMVFLIGSGVYTGSSVIVGWVPSIYMNQLLLFSSPVLRRQISDNFHK